MKKYLKDGLLLLIFIPFLLPAQDNKSQSQSIELPDFVITGVQTVDVPSAAKEKASLVSTLSKDFFLPQYSPEELPMADIDNPLSKKFDLWSGEKYYDGNVYFGFGRYTLPEGKFFMGQNFGNYLFLIDLLGSNTKDYVPYSSYNISSMSITNEFYINNSSNFLPGMKIYLDGNFFRDNYYFYNSANPTMERMTNNGYAEAGISNSSNRYLNYNASLSGSKLLINENGFRETNVSVDGGMEFKLPNFSIGVNTKYTQQNLTKSLSGNNNYYFFDINPVIKISTTSDLKVEAGVNYAATDYSYFFYPFGNIRLRLSRDLMFTAAFSPHAEFNTHRNFILSNIYYNLGTIDNLFTKYKIDLSAAFKYQYYKYFEIGISGGYAKIDDYYYFDESVEKGKFNINNVNGVNKFDIKLDLLFHPGPMGKFYGEVILQKVSNDSDQNLPYNPNIKTSLGYSYLFPFGFELAAEYKAALGYYSDILNRKEMPAYHNISLTFGYNIVNNLQLKFKLQNLLNRTNYIWNGYQEKPLDFILGIDYKW